ncbi:MAG: twin-arginine translocase subunit TatC [Armatimonadetes bacterium]|nr:twin-arginine translocase subunit TatC [Armatimonadota bacterium]
MALRRTDPESRNSPEPGELRATLGEHLEELRGRIMKSVLALAIASFAGWFGVKDLYNYFQKYISSALPKDFEWTFMWGSITDAFMFQLRMSFMIGAVVSMPFIVYQLWGFLKPGLKPQEQKPFQVVVPISIALFALGGFLGWWILPPTIQWFASMTTQFEGVGVLQNPTDIIGFCAKMIAAFGIGFQMPIIVFFLARFGIVTPQTIMRYWRHAVVGIAVAAGTLTPGGDPFSMMVLTIPLIILFFASVYAAKITMKSRDDKDEVLNNLD